MKVLDTGCCLHMEIDSLAHFNMIRPKRQDTLEVKESNRTEIEKLD